MPIYDVVPATEELAVEVALNMRQSDRDEVWASHRLAPVDAVLYAIMGSRDPNVGTVDGEPVIIFGDTPDSPIGRSTSPWMLATDEIVKHGSVFVPASRAFIHELLDDVGFTYLHNYVDARNTVSIRWLKRLGFTVYPAAPFGPDGLPFHFFDMRRPNV